jgi:hypothetical protein
MAGFKKAKTEQAALKIGMYGAAGSGKTFTALLFAEGLAALSNKKVAFVDTEHGTDFYCMNVSERSVHPKAFEFDALYSKSITEVLSNVKQLNTDEYSVVIIDSITHIWEAARLAYNGKETSAGTIPFHAWGKIKKPYKELINFLMSSPMHVIICGRQGNEFDEDEETGELKRIGTKAEGETPYEPHILIHMEAVKNPKTGNSTITAHAEKDRTGVIAGKTIQSPTYDSVIKPLVPLLGNKQAVIKSDAETSAMDAEIITEQDAAKELESSTILKRMKGRIVACESVAALKAIGAEITQELKSKMTTSHIADLRAAYLEAEAILR